MASGSPQALGLTTTADTFNPVIVDFYEQVGYLPEAILNYLLLLGWSFDDKREFFTREEMIANFSLERVTKAPASFDPKKLWAFQDHYMASSCRWSRRSTWCLPYLAAGRLDRRTGGGERPGRRLGKSSRPRATG